MDSEAARKNHAPPKLNTFFGAIHFEMILYATGAAAFMVLMCKERAERVHIVGAKTDALTGIANRGALFPNAQGRS